MQRWYFFVLRALIIRLCGLVNVMTRLWVGRWEKWSSILGRDKYPDRPFGTTSPECNAGEKRVGGDPNAEYSDPSLISSDTSARVACFGPDQYLILSLLISCVAL
jgi:hypothetical protein